MAENRSKSFVLVLLSGVLVLVTGLGFLVALKLDPTIDDWYSKVSSPRQSSLVLGTSFSNYGIDPTAMQAVGLPVEGRLYNFAFVNSLSSWGPAYFKAIEGKLDPKTKDGLFVLQVNPAGFKELVHPPRKGEEGLQESGGLLDRLWSFSGNPNWSYVVQNLDEPLWKFLWQRWTTNGYPRVTADGWTPQTVHNQTLDLQRNFPPVMDYYRSDIGTKAFSPLRWRYFEKTVEFLRPHGTVVLLRLPSTVEHASIEDELMPDLDARVEVFARAQGAIFLNWKGQRGDYLTSDGAHLESRSAVRFSHDLAVELKPILAARHRPVHTASQ